MATTERAKHQALVHAQYSCERGCGATGDQPALVLHHNEQCTLRLVPCIYCPLRVMKLDVGAHQNECGAREATCLLCNALTKRKEIRRHVHKTHGKPLEAVEYGKAWI